MKSLEANELPSLRVTMVKRWNCQRDCNFESGLTCSMWDDWWLGQSGGMTDGDKKRCWVKDDCLQYLVSLNMDWNYVVNKCVAFSPQGRQLHDVNASGLVPTTLHGSKSSSWIQRVSDQWLGDSELLGGCKVLKGLVIDSIVCHVLAIQVVCTLEGLKDARAPCHRSIVSSMAACCMNKLIRWMSHCRWDLEMIAAIA